MENQLVLAQNVHKYIGERANAQRVNAEIQANPERLLRLEGEMDAAIQTLNTILETKSYSRLCTKTTELLLRESRPERLPTLQELKQDGSSATLRAAVTTLKEVNGLMALGEGPEPPPHAWRVHAREGEDTDKLIAATMLAIYTAYIEQRYSTFGLDGFEHVTLPLEEVLAVYYPTSYLFHLIREWYTAEEGFSEELVEHVETYPVILQEHEIDEMNELFQEIERHMDDEDDELLISALEDFQRYKDALEVKYGLKGIVADDWHFQFIRQQH